MGTYNEFNMRPIAIETMIAKVDALEGVIDLVLHLPLHRLHQLLDCVLVRQKLDQILVKPLVDGVEDILGIRALSHKHLVGEGLEQLRHVLIDHVHVRSGLDIIHVVHLEEAIVHLTY